jgi:DUF1680 family protein
MQSKAMKTGPLLLIVGCLTPCWAAAPQPVIPLKVTDRFLPAPYESQRIEGVLGERMRVNLEKRLLRIEEDALLAGFRQRPGNHPWIGEHIGKYLHAAVNTWRYTRHPALKTQMDRMALELIKTQKPDGYLGTYADAERWTSWDVWVHKYNLIGLMAWYELSGDGRALDACKKMGDLLHKTFVEDGRDIIASSTHVGMAATSALEGIVTLYRYSGDPKHLALAEHIVRSWEQPNGPKIMSSLLGPKPNVYRTGNAKAYEMMSDLVGLIELYRVTGKPEYLKVAMNAQQDISLRRTYLTGTVSTHEHFQDDFVLPGEPANDVGEGCATVTWLQLNWQLLRITGEARFAEELERTVFNQLIAAQDSQTGDICYFTPMNGRKRVRTDINCCRSSEPRGISMIPQLAWGTVGDSLAVLIYAPGEVKANGWEVRAGTRFPEEGTIELSVRHAVAEPRTLMLRVPGWARDFLVDGRRARAEAGFVTLRRDWSAGQKVRVQIGMTPRWAPGGLSYPGHVAAVYGPRVYALDREANPNVPYLQRVTVGKAPRLAMGEGRLKVQGQALNATGGLDPVELTLVPFADAREYRIWLNTRPPSRQLPVSLALGARELLSSRDEEFHGVLADEEYSNERRTRPRRERQDEGFDSFGIQFETATAVRRLRFHQGSVLPQGGWFDPAAGKPVIEVQRNPGGAWEPVARLDSYPNQASEVKRGAVYEAAFPEPITVRAIRVRGKRGGAFTSCTELELLP